MTVATTSTEECSASEISATLRMPSGREPVNFNAVLQPSSLRYSISRAARATRNN